MNSSLMLKIFIFLQYLPCYCSQFIQLNLGLSQESEFNYAFFLLFVASKLIFNDLHWNLFLFFMKFGHYHQLIHFENGIAYH